MTDRIATKVYTPPVPPSTHVPVTTTSEVSSAVPTTTSAPPPPPPPPTSSGPITVPTPIPQTCPTPGTYTFPATTVVVTETTTVCGASTTSVPAGTHTLGGVTTVVETATTVVCPVATTKTEGGVVTSVIETTTYVCPTPGTYTIAPITTTVTEDCVVAVPVVSTFVPGTYTAPAVVTTIVETNVVVYCPFTEVVATPTAVPEAPKPEAPKPAPEVPEPAPEAPKPAPEAPKPKETAPKPSTNKPSTNLGGKGDIWAMTYTPFTTDGQCKTAEEVKHDIAAIASAGFTTLRVYSTDCETLTHVGPAAAANGLKLIIGVFIGTTGCDNGSPNVAEQIAAIKAWGKWDMVELVVVGNEALFNNFCTPGQLKDLIINVKTQLNGAGYTGPYTTTDVVSAWIGNDVSEICANIDVVATNAHAYFNAGTLPKDAGVFVKGQLEIVEELCGKPGFVMETGWPTAGECIGVACPGVEQQAVALESIKKELGKKVVFFSASDDAWKNPGACNCEQHWGCSNVFGFSF